VPVDSSALGADVHLFEWLNFSPAKFTMWDELLIFFDLLHRRNIFIADNSSVLFGDDDDLFPAEGAVGMITPPLHDTVQTEDMTTC